MNETKYLQRLAQPKGLLVFSIVFGQSCFCFQFCTGIPSIFAGFVPAIPSRSKECIFFD